MIPLGIRNNNPGNIRKSSQKWLGKIPQEEPFEFEKFHTMAHGIRALAKVLLTYYNKHNLRTIEEIISRYAPSSDKNNTKSYIKYVHEETNSCPYTNVIFEEDMELNEVDNLASLVRIIINYENGKLSGMKPYIEFSEIVKVVKELLEK
mgnify:CR=1 FL=1